MVQKHPHHARTPDVVVPLDYELFDQLLYRGVGGKFASEIGGTKPPGYTPFERTCEPSTYSCADSFRRDYLIGMMWSKFDDEKSASDKATSALMKFHLAEDRCSDTNARLRSARDARLEHLASAKDVLYVARRKIARLLGEFSWDEAELGFGFGPGATTRLRRDRSTLLHKVSGKPEATFNCADLARTVLRYNRLWEESALNEPGGEEPIVLVRANRVVTVPKNAKTDRVIAIEPDLNIYTQKGIGAMIRRRLRWVGVNLNDQTRNQVLAREGSISGLLATLDLSMASDTVSRAIVEELLPVPWVDALETCRSPEGILPCGKIIRYHKFSSMGNGYTFELESLIFWALCSAVTELMGERDAVIGVYGDDLIVNTGIVRTLTGLLEYCGFFLNPEKSFSDGPFRESCGKHYFAGYDVTPFFVRKQPRRISDVFLLHNNVVRWCNKGSFRDSGVGGSLEAFCTATRNAVPTNWRKPRLPADYGDGAFIGSFDEACPKKAPRGYEGYRATVLAHVPVDLDRRRCYISSAPLLASLHQLERRRAHSSSLPRSAGFHSAPGGLRGFGSSVDDWVGIKPPSDPGRTRVVTKAKIQKILITQWAELGPWY